MTLIHGYGLFRITLVDHVAERRVKTRAGIVEGKRSYTGQRVFHKESYLKPAVPVPYGHEGLSGQRAVLLLHQDVNPAAVPSGPVYEERKLLFGAYLFVSHGDDHVARFKAGISGGPHLATVDGLDRRKPCDHEAAASKDHTDRVPAGDNIDRFPDGERHPPYRYKAEKTKLYCSVPGFAGVERKTRGAAAPRKQSGNGRAGSTHRDHGRTRIYNKGLTLQ